MTTLFYLILGVQGVSCIISLVNFTRNSINLERQKHYTKLMNELEHRAPHHIEDLQGDIMQSNTNLGSDVKILMPGGDGDDRVKFIRFRDVLRTKQFYLLIFVYFCQTAFWMLLVSTVIYCEGSQQVYNSPNGFFSVGSNGLVNALAIAATAQPLVGYVSDHIGVRFSFMLWLLTMGTVAFIIPLFVRKMKKDETIDQILIELC